MYHRRSWSRSRWIGQNNSEKSEHGMLKMTSLVLRFSSNSLCLGMCCICRCLKLSVPISTFFTPISYSPRQAFTCPATVWGLTDGESDNLAIPMDVLAEMDKVSCTSVTTFPFIPHWFLEPVQLETCLHIVALTVGDPSSSSLTKRKYDVFSSCSVLWKPILLCSHSKFFIKHMSSSW